MITSVGEEGVGHVTSRLVIYVLVVELSSLALPHVRRENYK